MGKLFVVSMGRRESCFVSKNVGYFEICNQKSLINPDQYPLRQYLADEPHAKLRRIVFLIRRQNCPLRNPEFMYRKSIVLYLDRNGWTAQVIHRDLVATLGEQAIAYSAVTKYSREVQISPGDPTA
jgi:hypothetical protein